MHPKSIYIASAQPRAGSLIITLGLMEMLKGSYKHVAFFRPIIPNIEEGGSDIDFMLRHFDLDMKYEECCGFTVNEYVEAYAEDKDEKLLEAHFEVVYEDRPLSPGEKFKDADLIGFPYKLIFGKGYLKDGLIEVKRRRDGEVFKVKPEEIEEFLRREIYES